MRTSIKNTFSYRWFMYKFRDCKHSIPNMMHFPDPYSYYQPVPFIDIGCSVVQSGWCQYQGCNDKCTQFK